MRLPARWHAGCSWGDMNEASTPEHDVWLDKISSALRSLRKSGWSRAEAASKEAESAAVKWGGGTRAAIDPPG